MMFSIKVNEHIELLFPHTNYAEELFTVVNKNREYLGKWLPWVERTLNIYDSRQFLETSIDKYYKGMSVETIIAFDGKIVGTVGIHHINPLYKSCEIGYWIGEEYAGRGIVTLSAAKIIEYAFSMLDLNKIKLLAAVENTKSRNIAIRLGFEEEGTLKEEVIVNNIKLDCKIYGLTKTKYLNINK